MNIFDIVIGILLILGFYKGYKNGLILEITSLLGLIIGIIGAFYFTTYHGLYIGQWLNWDEPYLKIATFVKEYDKKRFFLGLFVISFILIVIVVALIGKALTKVIDYAALGFVNKLFGGIFGTLKFALILSILLLVFNAINNTTNLVDRNTLGSSLFYPYLNEFSDFIWPKLIEITEENKDMLENIPSDPE